MSKIAYGKLFFALKNTIVSREMYSYCVLVFSNSVVVLVVLVLSNFQDFVLPNQWELHN